MNYWPILSRRVFPAGITRVEHSFQPQDLIDGKADAISAYVTNEPYFLDHAGF